MELKWICSYLSAAVVFLKLCVCVCLCAVREYEDEGDLCEG